MAEEGTARNNKEIREETATEPTTTEEARILIAKLKDLRNYIEVCVEDKRLEKIGTDSEIFVLEREGEIAPYTLWQHSRQTKEELKRDQQQHEKIKRAIKDIEQKWDICEEGIEAIGPWQDSLNNHRRGEE